MFPSSALQRQDRIFSKAFSILEKAIASRAFPAASVAITHDSRLVALKAFGHFTDETPEVAPSLSRSVRQGGDFDVTTATLFDLLPNA